MSRLTELRQWLALEYGCLAEAKYEPDINYHEQEIADLEKTILKFERYDLIARLCIMKNLPAGDPAWIAKLISSFIVPPIEEEDTSWHCKCCCPCCREE